MHHRQVRLVLLGELLLVVRTHWGEQWALHARTTTKDIRRVGYVHAAPEYARSVQNWSLIQPKLPVVIVHVHLHFLVNLFFIFLAFGVILLDLISINHDLETTSADVHILSEDDSLTDTPHGINFRKNCS